MTEPLLLIRGEPRTIRTLHAPDQRRDGHRLDGERQPNTLDRLVTHTMPMIRAMRDDVPIATMTVML